MKKNHIIRAGSGALALAVSLALSPTAEASSHMDAPLITLDPAANTTDVYAFVGDYEGQKMLMTALGVYPHQEPGVGPNKYNFDDEVLYAIHVSTGSDVAAGIATYTYEFQFETTYRNSNTILQSYLGVVEANADANQNLIQTYMVTKVNNSTGIRTELGTGIVPPNNQGIATPYYNVADNGENPAKPGVSTLGELDRYTAGAIAALSNNYMSFAGQRDDGFYGDIQSIFDLLQLRDPGVDSQGGFNIHMMSLAIPLDELGGDQQVVGVYATTSREKIDIVTDYSYDQRRKVRTKRKNRRRTVREITFTRTIRTTQTPVPRMAQVGRQGNPLFNEALVAIRDKDLYSRTSPSEDDELFRDYAETPELAALINAIVFGGSGPAIEENRTDIAGIYIPDVIKVDLSTPVARLAGAGPMDADNPDDAGFSNQSIFGGDTLLSAIQDPFDNGGQIPGGWPNGRRFGDDVIDIAVTALISDLRTNPVTINSAAGIDGVNSNDAGYNKVFPYESTPQNGRNHIHP
ncbi:MAG: hypothetical protein CMO55_14675 [Verrucomicrobiales bacterium]|nr:hypothetical protein [Verrucomicrobiales bacterium]